MRTAEEVLQYYFNWSLIEDDNFKDNVVNAMKEFAKEVAKEALKNASENAETICGNSEKDKKGIPTGYCGSLCGGCENLIVDKQSILNESNIPKL